MERYAINVDGITRRFGETTAVNNLSLQIETGEIFGFLGHNGAGKTTTVRLLNGVLQHDNGEVQVLGLNPQTEGTQLRKRTGVLTETPSLDERLTGIDNLTIYADLYGVSEPLVKSRVMEMLEIFGLAERGEDRVGGYSKGMKQRLALARAFLHEPELIFLDEPTSGLDPIATQEVHEMIRHVSQDEGRTVFLCTHNLVEAQRLCNRVAVMEHGNLVAVGTPSELAQKIGAEVYYTITVATNQLEKARAKLSHSSSVNQVRSDGDKLVITVTDREVIPDVLVTLINEQIRVYAFTPQETSLEDIYMALHQRQEVTS